MNATASTPSTASTIAVFDFDGTLTTRDSFFHFLRNHRPPAAFALDQLATAPLLLRYALHLAPNETHKMALFARGFAGLAVDRFQLLAHEFSLQWTPKNLRPVALDRLRSHQRLGHRVVIVSASIVDWIQPWAARHGVAEVLASTLEIHDGRLTGRLDGPNCCGPEKLRRFLAAHPDRAAYRLHVYGDSRGDAALLAAADHAYFRRFA